MSAHPGQLRTRPTPATVLVRDAGPNDREAMADVVSAAFAQYAAVLPSAVFREYLADLLDFDLHAGHGDLLLAALDGRVVGSVAFYRDIASQRMGWPQGWAGGRGLAVHPGARGQHVARALLGECERRARMHGSGVFAFHTATVMTAAIALYEHLGYRRAPRYDLDLAAHFAITGIEPIPSIAYRRDLLTRSHR